MRTTVLYAFAIGVSLCGDALNLVLSMHNRLHPSLGDWQCSLLLLADCAFRLQVLQQPFNALGVRIVVLPVGEVRDEIFAYLFGGVFASMVLAPSIVARPCRRAHGSGMVVCSSQLAWRAYAYPCRNEATYGADRGCSSTSAIQAGHAAAQCNADDLGYVAPNTPMNSAASD